MGGREKILTKPSVGVGGKHMYAGINTRTGLEVKNIYLIYNGDNLVISSPVFQAKNVRGT